MKSFEVREALKTYSEQKYREFIKKLVPGEEYIIGVRTPTIRKLARTLEDPEEYIKLEALYLEEKLLKGFIIAPAKKYGIVQKINLFIGEIDSWCVCDSFCSALKSAKRSREAVWEKIVPYIYSEKEFEVRFAVVMMLNYFLEDEYIDRVFRCLEDARHSGYYAQMAVAWAVSAAFRKYPEKTAAFLKQCGLPRFTYDMSKRKIREIRRTNLPPGALELIRNL